MTTTITDNAAWAAAQPRLSVLIPFMHDDPTALLAALDGADGDAEVVILDDGTGDDDLADRVAAAVMAMTRPARFVRLATNEGRSKGRNRLAANARASHLLFLDSDMMPDRPSFLADWLALIDADNPAVAFGGFSLDQTPRRRDTEVHRAMALRSDCTPASLRRLEPEKHVFTSNLLVRRDVFDTEGFDTAFAGWGWEDVEWAMRVGRRHAIVHIDNTATHLGLDAARTLAAKYEQSAANFARVVAAHHDLVSAYPSYRAARLLKRVPARGAWRPLLKAAALSEVGPTAARAFALRLYRAALYAEAV
jgi:glycosyltransferase involved in cell wall biosynthesis